MITPKPALWRWVIGTLLILVIWQLGGAIATIATALFLSVPLDDLPTFPQVEPWRALLIVLVSFIPLFLIVPLSYRLLLQLPWKRVITPFKKISARRIGHGFLAMSAILIPLLSIELIFNQSAFKLTFNLREFLPYLLIALTFLFIQTTSEEFFFRGWLLHWLDNGKLPTWAIALISGALFAAPHMVNPEIKGDYLFSFISFAAIGIALTLATLRDRTLELAIGAHFANNFLAGTLVGYQDSALPSAAIFFTGELNWAASAATSIAIIPLFLWLTRPKKVERFQ
ncbi:MAG: CPBP family intramembrane metalloprotease [Actinomycetota bacterium]|nr:CPBP family intramembrane metalloprotease [Actinomycetota bacterium]